MDGSGGVRCDSGTAGKGWRLRCVGNSPPFPTFSPLSPAPPAEWGRSGDWSLVLLGGWGIPHSGVGIPHFPNLFPTFSEFLRVGNSPLYSPHYSPLYLSLIRCVKLLATTRTTVQDHFRSWHRPRTQKCDIRILHFSWKVGNSQKS